MLSREDVIELTHNWVDLFNEMFPTLNLAQPAVSFFSKSVMAGCAYCSSNRLEFNEILMKQDGFENTVVHEIAHLIVKKLFPFAKQAHGPEFRRVMNAVGFEGTTYHKYDISEVRKTKRYEYKCSCKIHNLSAIRHNNQSCGRTRYKCSLCGESLVDKFTGKIV